jgi:hypothetical protein
VGGGGSHNDSPKKKIHCGQTTGERGFGKIQNVDECREFYLVRLAAMHRLM